MKIILTVTIHSWIDKHGLNINAFLVEDVEQVKA